MLTFLFVVLVASELVIVSAEYWVELWFRNTISIYMLTIRLP